MITHNPLHGSGQASFPHPALTLGDNAHASQEIGMTDGRQRQPASDEAPHTVPEDASVLATPRQRTMPEPSHLESKKSQRRVVQGHSVIPEVSTHHRLQPLALFRDGFIHTTLKFGFHRVQLRLQPFADRLPQHRVHSVAPLLHADMREAEKVECLGLPFSASLPVVDRKRTKFQQPRFLGMQFQVELPHSFGEFRPELFGIRFALESNHDIVCESHDDDITVRSLSTPRLDPQGFRGFTGSLSLRPVEFTSASIAAKPSSLHPLRHRFPDVVRGLLRYYRAVRLPRSVRHRRASLDFPMRPEATAALGGRGISRFPCEVFPYVLGVSRGL